MMGDMTIMIIVLGFVGLCFGSFAGAQVWRLRAWQLAIDRAEGEDYDKNEYKQLTKLTKHKGVDDRSRCLSCAHQLAWYDLLPLVSWLSTRGRCRYCKQKIGIFEPLIEIGTAIFFVTSYLVWPVDIFEPLAAIQFALWLVSGVMLAILFAYDAKWFLLPNRVVFPLIAVSAVYSALNLVGLEPSAIGPAIVSVGASVAILSGLYLAIWFVSKGQWIGFGDVKLGLALGLLLGQWELAFLALFVANLIGCIIVLPGIITRKLTRTTQVPFGPMLVLGFLVAAWWGQPIIGWYLSMTITLMI